MLSYHQKSECWKGRSRSTGVNGRVRSRCHDTEDRGRPGEHWLLEWPSHRRESSAISLTSLAYCSLLLLLLVTLPGPSLAQVSGAALQGAVTDPTGGVIPDAKVEITEISTGVSRSTNTNNAGIYSAQNLPAGRYKVVVNAPGFEAATADQVLLTVGAVQNLDIQLSLGGASTRVLVTATPPSVDTASSTVQGVVDAKTTRQLPLNGRDWTDLSALQPGVSAILTQNTAISTGTDRLNRGLGAQFSIGGNRPQQNNYLLDGISVNDYANGGPGSALAATLGVDAIQEFSVITSNAPAQYGRSSGGIINSITRSGGDQFHGSIYEYLRNSALDARNFFDGPKIPSFRRNQFGASLGGPIIRRKTFFFADYEGVRQALGLTQTSVVLSPAARQGNLVSGAVKISPSVAPFLALYPLPNGVVSGDTGNYNFVANQVTNEDFWTAHVDHIFSNSDTLRFTALYDTSSASSPDASDALLDAALARRAAGVLEETHIFSSRFTNVARFGYSRSVAKAPQTLAVLNPAAGNTSLGFIPAKPPGQLIVTGLQRFQGGPGGFGSFAYHYNSYQGYDNATFVLGKHTLSFGGSVERIQDNQLGGVLPNGEYSFGSIKAFLTNNKASFYESALPATPPTPRDLRQTIGAGYIQDDWRVRTNLTLNLGLRYEAATNISETAGRLAKLVNITDPAATVVSNLISNPTLKNFEPRLGFAWDPFKKNRTVVRGAFGVYDVLPLPYLFALDTIGAAPFYEEGRNTKVAAGAFPLNGFGGLAPRLREAYYQPNPGRNYVLQETLNIQQQLTASTVFTLGYIGSHGVHQPFNANDINIVLPTLTANGYQWPVICQGTNCSTGGGTVQNPAVGTVTGHYWNGSSVYNSLQAGLRKDLSHNLQGQVSYTWSKSLDNSSSSVAGATFGNSVANLPFFDQRLNRGLSDFDARHVFSANYLYTLPSPTKQNRALYLFLGNWTYSGIVSIRSGNPFSATIGGDPLGTNSTSSFQYPNRSCPGNQAVHPQNVNYLNTSCFSVPALGLLGNSGRNSLIGPGLIAFTMGLMKETAINERVHTQFQAQAFNIFNRVNFQPPQSTQQQIFNASGNPLSTAGQLTLTATSSRQLQFSLKVLF